MATASCSNHTTPLPDEPLHTINIILQIILFITGLLSNGLVMYIIVRYPTLRNAPNLYILNLSLAQFLYYIREILQVTYMLIGSWTFGVAVCKLYRFLWSVSIFAGSGFLTILSVERHQAVVNPVVYWADHLAHERRVAFRNACVLWGVVTFLCVPHLVFANVMLTSCVLDCYYDSVGSLDAHSFNTIRVFYSVGLGFVVPLIIMIPHYVFLIIRLREGQGEAQGRNANVFSRVSRLVVVLVTIFVVSNLPGHVVNIAVSAFDERTVKLSLTAQWFFYALQDVSPCLSPILCVIVAENFRSALLKTLCNLPVCPEKCRPSEEQAVRARSS